MWKDAIPINTTKIFLPNSLNSWSRKNLLLYSFISGSGTTGQCYLSSRITKNSNGTSDCHSLNKWESCFNRKRKAPAASFLFLVDKQEKDGVAGMEGIRSDFATAGPEVTSVTTARNLVPVLPSMVVAHGCKEWMMPLGWVCVPRGPAIVPVCILILASINDSLLLEMQLWK